MKKHVENPVMVDALVQEVQWLLRQQSTPEAAAACRKFNPSAQDVYGVRVPVLNNLAKQFARGGFDLVAALWQRGAFEERLLAVKLLGQVCRKDPARTLEMMLQFSVELQDWAVCDTLGTQGVRGIAVAKQAEIVLIAEQLVQSQRMWQQRLAIVLLTNYAKRAHMHPEILRIVQPLETTRDKYIKMGLAWLKRDMAK